MFDDDDGAGLGVDFTINPAESYNEVAHLIAVMDSAEGKILANANRIEGGTSGMVKLAGASKSVTAFADAAARDLTAVGSAMAGAGVAADALAQKVGRTAGMSILGPSASREAAATTREINRTEKEVDKLVAAMIREAAAVGKTREELRDMKVEALALKATELGVGGLADDLLSAARTLSAAKSSLAEDRLAADMAAAAAAAREQASALDLVNAQLMERARLQAALDRTNGQDRPRATDAGASFSALAAKAAEDEARATSLAASAARQHADEHARLAAMVQASHAAQMADVASLERLRASTDPLYAATSRLNAEIAESTRLYNAGVTPQAEYIRQQDVLAQRMRQTASAHDEAERSSKRAGHTMQQLSFQVNDVATMAMSGASPMQIFGTQIGQIVQVAQGAEGGMKGFARQIGGLVVAGLPVIAMASVAGVAFYRWNKELEKTANMKKYAEGLGLTKKEMKELKDVSITAGDVMGGIWKTLNDRLETKGKGKKLVDYLFGPNDAQQVAGFVAEIYGYFVGGYKGIVEVWGLLPAAIGDFVSRSAKSTVVAIEAMVNGTIDRVNALAKGANALIGTDLFGQIDRVKIDTPGIDAAVAAYAGAGQKAGAAFGKNVAAETKAARAWMKGVGDDVEKNIIGSAEKRLRKQRDKIVEDRTDKKDKPDRHAEALARDAQAIEAQIRNLYALADAYGVSGAAALVAEARVKAESRAIKQRGDVEAAVSREVQLAIAERVSDAAKATASVRDQAVAQERVNAMVLAGLVPSERASQIVQDQIADLPLLAAIEAAQQRGLVDGATRATKALADQRAERERLAVAEERRQFDTDMASGTNRLAELREELRLVGATDAERVHALATIRATQEAEAKFRDPALRQRYVDQQVQIADETERTAAATRDLNDALTFNADRWDLIAQNVSSAASGMADAFGDAGRALGDMTSIFADYRAQQERARVTHEAAMKAATSQAGRDRENARFALASSGAQVAAFGDMASAAKGFFKEGSSGYQMLAGAEKAFRLVQFALSARAIATDAIETGSKIANSVARTAAGATEAVVNAIKSLPFPLNLAAGAATVAALASIGVSIAGGFGSSKNTLPASNTGTGTVLGDADAKSESLKRSIDQLREVDTVTSVFAREMAGSLRSIDNQIGGLASVLVRSGNIDASAGVTEGFKTNAVGSILKAIVPVFGGALASLFGTKTTVVGSGLYAGAQSIGDIMSGGFDASTYSDVQKKKKLFGITTSTKYSTQYAAADVGLENQFGLILRSFATSIAQAADPLGEATAAVQARLNGFVVNIGKIDLQGLTGTQIQEKLEAVFGAAADGMAEAAFPGISRFQKAGEGAFETLVRVASTLEAVSTSLDLLGNSAQAMSIDAKLGLADQFDSVGDLTSAVDAYFTSYYTKAEQSAAQAAQMQRVFASIGLVMPGTLASFRQLVEAQDLTTTSGQATYATLLQLAPAFASLQSALSGAKSAADVAAERQDLERQLLELRGDTAALRALELAKLDASNRGLQEQIYAVQDAQAAAAAAKELADAWSSAGDSILDEVKRIRGLTDAGEGNSFASLMGQFNAANAAARGGDLDAAKSLPALSQALLKAAADVATSRQELARVQAQTAAALEATYGVVGAAGKAAPTSTTAMVVETANNKAVVPAPTQTSDMADRIRELTATVEQLRLDNNAGHAATAGNTGRVVKKLDDVTAASGGDAIAIASAA